MSFVETAKAPLEVLVVAQLAAIKQQERVLKTRLTSPSAGTQTAATVSEIAALQGRMDRLNRMMDAMSSTWCQPKSALDDSTVS